MKARNVILIVLTALLAVIPLWMNSGAEFGGADGQAEEAIIEIRPDYEPWFGSLWEPPSREIEGLLFALQAAIGAGFIGYFLGSARKARKGRNFNENEG